MKKKIRRNRIQVNNLARGNKVLAVTVPKISGYGPVCIFSLIHHSHSTLSTSPFLLKNTLYKYSIYNFITKLKVALSQRAGRGSPMVPDRNRNRVPRDRGDRLR